jgi:hypothetical protein
MLYHWYWFLTTRYCLMTTRNLAPWCQLCRANDALEPIARRQVFSVVLCLLQNEESNISTKPPPCEFHIMELLLTVQCNFGEWNELFDEKTRVNILFDYHFNERYLFSLMTLFLKKACVGFRFGWILMLFWSLIG